MTNYPRARLKPIRSSLPLFVSTASNSMSAESVSYERCYRHPRKKQVSECVCILSFVWCISRCDRGRHGKRHGDNRTACSRSDDHTEISAQNKQLFSSYSTRRKKVKRRIRAHARKATVKARKRNQKLDQYASENDARTGRPHVSRRPRGERSTARPQKTQAALSEQRWYSDVEVGFTRTLRQRRKGNRC